MESLYVFHTFWKLDSNFKKKVNITKYTILQLCYAKTTDPLTNVLENEKSASNWLQVKEHLWLNFYNSTTESHTASRILEDMQVVTESKQQYVARYKSSLHKSSVKSQMSVGPKYKS